MVEIFVFFGGFAFLAFARIATTRINVYYIRKGVERNSFSNLLEYHNAVSIEGASNKPLYAFWFLFITGLILIIAGSFLLVNS